MSDRELIAAQRDTIDELRETVRQLEESMCPVRLLPREWRLTGAEERLLSALAASRADYLSKDRLLTAMNGIDCETDVKIVDVFIFKLRKKLPPEIEIETIWGRGYALTPAGRAAFQRADSYSNGSDDVANFQINFKIDDKVKERLAVAAKAAGMSPTMYAKMLFEAAYAARHGATGDRDLDATVAAALILSGAELDSDEIARALKCSEETVTRIKSAWDASQTREAA